MTVLKARLSAIALIVTTLVTGGVGVLGAQGRYDMCTAKQHDCGCEQREQAELPDRKAQSTDRLLHNHPPFFYPLIFLTR